MHVVWVICWLFTS